MTFNGFCHDCDAPVEVLCSVNKGEIVISGGAMYNPIMGTPPIEHTFFKCDACFKNDKTLRNFVPCEIFSRVVGYLRPVEQWNIGKKEEFKQRKEYVVWKIGGDKKITRYKVSFVSAKTGEREFLRDYKGRIRYYSKEKASEMAKILKERKGRIVKTKS